MKGRDLIIYNYWFVFFFLFLHFDDLELRNEVFWQTVGPIISYHWRIMFFYKYLSNITVIMDYFSIGSVSVFAFFFLFVDYYTSSSPVRLAVAGSAAA